MTNEDRMREAVKKFETAATELSESLVPFGITDLPLSDKIIEAKEIVVILEAAKLNSQGEA